jgi:hypothetical protein
MSDYMTNDGSAALAFYQESLSRRLTIDSWKLEEDTTIILCVQNKIIVYNQYHLVRDVIFLPLGFRRLHVSTLGDVFHKSEAQRSINEPARE